MLSLSDLRIDPRIQREAQALARAGYHVKILAPDTDSHSLIDDPLDWGTGITFSILPSTAGIFVFRFPFLFGHEMLVFAMKETPFAFHCHDLPTAIIGLSAARYVGAHTVCDFHEWWSENVSWNHKLKKYTAHSWFGKILFKWAESLAVSKADAVITVCDSIADELRKLSSSAGEISVIRNIPPIKLLRPSDERISLRNYLAIPEKALLLLWQGGTGPGRNIEPIIQALALAPGIVFAIRGPALDIFGESYRRLAESLGVSDRLIFLDLVPSSQVVDAAFGADIGIWSLENLGKNFMYALPNKVFEYLAAEVPVMGASFPEVKKLLEGYQVGACFNPDSPTSIAGLLNHLYDHPEKLRQMRNRIPAMLHELDAGHEWDKVAGIYASLAAESYK